MERFSQTPRRTNHSQTVILFSSSVLIIFVLSLIETGAVALSPSIEATVDRNRTQGTQRAEIEYIHVNSIIRYRYCRTQVLVKVVNKNLQVSREINFNMNIPKIAFISNFTIKSNNRTYIAAVVEKENASIKYSSAKYFGHTAGIIQDERDTKNFKVSVNVEAKSNVLLTLVYEELIELEYAHYVYKIHLDPHQMRDINEFVVKVDIKEFPPIQTLHIANLGGQTQAVKLSNVESQIQHGGNSTIIIWRPNENKTQYDELISEKILGQFKILYTLEVGSKPGEILLRDGYFVHTINTWNLPVLPKHVVFVLDVSGSMMGDRLTALQTALRSIFDELRPQDYFNIITFSTNVENWSPFTGKCLGMVVPYDVSDTYKNLAVDFINNLQVHGSTNINDALMEALRFLRKFSHVKKHKLDNQTLNCYFPRSYYETNPTSMIIFLTDGEPTSGIIDHNQILRNIKFRNSKAQIPIFSLAFGSTADYNFVKHLSLKNHGYARRIYEGLQSSMLMKNFFSELSSPVLSNVSFLYTSPTYTISNVTISHYSVINLNKEVQITGKIRRKPSSVQIIVSSATSNKKDCSFNVTTLSKFALAEFEIFCFCSKDTDGFVSNNTLYDPSETCLGDDFFMERRWAYTEIMNLIDKAYSDSAPPTDAIEVEKIVNMAVKYHFVTPYTSLIVVKESKDKNLNGPEMNTINVDAGIENDLKKNKNAAVSSSGTTEKPVITTKFSSHSSISSTNSNNILSSFSSGLDVAIPDRLKKIITSTPKHYSLANIEWLDTHKYIPFANDRNETFVYSLISAYTQTDPLPTQNCTVNFLYTFTGKCQHLKDCVVREILADFDAFLHSYFCPLNTGQGRFIGICCGT